MGDPSGIGPEVTVKALASSKVKGRANFLVIGDKSVLRRAARSCGVKLSRDILDIPNVPAGSFAHGKLSARFGMAAMRYIDAALEMLLRRKALALVTAPINKSSVRSAGFKDFQGHTEYLAEKSGVKKFTMLFVGPGLKVALVTRHIPLRRVSEILDKNAIHNAILLTNKYLRSYFNIKSPRIGVLGLNPHAGEGGSFGDEEAAVILPAINKASRSVKNIFGPLPADVAFYDALKGKYDAIVAMYHDQALTTFKTLYFNSGVNMTLGLPFIRTSPDHGTAFDIAGKDMADPSSMIEAILLARRLAKKC